MFSNLSKGSVLYGLDTKGEVRLFTATVDTVSIPRPKYMQNTFGQLPEMVLDIVANVNGERKEYKEIPVNNAIADFGPNTFVLSDSKDSLTNYLKAKLQESENIVNSRSVHEALIPQYKQALGELNPEIANDNAVKELRGQVESMQNQLAEALALLRQKASNPTV
jgi:hypothetical protein